MSHLRTVLFIFWWPAALWIIPCCLISFVDWHNYFIYPIAEWPVVARLFFMVFSLFGIMVYIMVESLDANPNHQ